VDRPTIFEAAGGAPAFEALARAHHARCLADPVLEHPFSHGIDPDHVPHLAAYWGEVFGGPPAYSTAIGEQTRLLRIHAGTNAEADLGPRFVACFTAALDDAAIPPDPDLRHSMRSYMEWATADVMSYAPAGSEVPGGLAVPRWSWDGPVT
jgi:hemoglobin